MITLKSLEVKGFRAFMEKTVFAFDNPAILLLGENHCGKSSTLNAIEWCLFGNDCIGKGTGIRERIDWEIPNRNMRPPDLSVELDLEDEATGVNFTICRRWISTRKDDLKLTLPDGQPLIDQDAKEKIAQLLKSSFRDFMTTVYQHQEAIRAILIQEPKERNDAIDRLLGLSDYRNVLTGIETAKLPAKQKKMGDDFDIFTKKIDVALHTRESDLKDKRERGIQKGLKKGQLSKRGILDIASEVRDQLFEFVSKVGFSLPVLQVPEQSEDLYPFQEMADEHVRRLRSEMPDVKRQKELFDNRTEFTELKTEYEGKKKELKNICEEIEEFAKENGSEESLNRAKADTELQISQKEKEISEANAKAAAISKVMNYLRIEGVDKNKCPICGKDTTDLLKHLEKEWEKKYEEQVGIIQKQLNELQTRSKNTESLLTQCRKLKEHNQTVVREITEVDKKIGEALGREITGEDDPLVLLNNQLNRVEKGLRKLEQAIESKQKTLNGIATLLEQIQLIADVLNLEGKKRIVEQIQQSIEYKQMEKSKDEVAILIDDINKIKQAVREASHGEAQEKISTAGERIDNYFHRIVNNPSVSKIEFSVSEDSRTGRSNYEFKDQNGNDLTPILSQGDLNAMALSIFLGMACSGGISEQFGFVMLDDPSQSLGSEHKENLVGVLDEVLKERMVILASMDKELQDLLVSRITKSKTKYIFADWTPQTGPEVRKE